MRRLAGAASLLALAGLAVAAPADDTSPSALAGLPGWASEDHAEALAVWVRSCVDGPLCAAGTGTDDARGFLETHLVLAPEAAVPAFVTGYFEPELDAAPARGPAHPVPLHALPDDPALRAFSRAEIAAGALEGRVPVLYWLADPVDAFFLHVQGSGRLRLPDGRRIRVGYAGRNDHPYRSIGRLLVEREGIDPAAMTADRLAGWLRADPARGRALMETNPSYIFFRKVEGLGAADGPVGAAGVPLTRLRSVALDPAHHAPGGLYWLETTLPPEVEGGAPRPFRALVVAQDTGSAIRGPGRVDLFFGSGAEAGLAAGRMRAEGRLVPLVPRAAGPEAVR